jgi:hypothetical protein
MDDQADRAILSARGSSTRDLTTWYFTAAVFWFVFVPFLWTGVPALLLFRSAAKLWSLDRIEKAGAARIV